MVISVEILVDPSLVIRPVLKFSEPIGVGDAERQDDKVISDGCQGQLADQCQ